MNIILSKRATKALVTIAHIPSSEGQTLLSVKTWDQVAAAPGPIAELNAAHIDVNQGIIIVTVLYFQKRMAMRYTSDLDVAPAALAIADGNFVISDAEVLRLSYFPEGDNIVVMEEPLSSPGSSHVTLVETTGLNAFDVNEGNLTAMPVFTYFLLKKGIKAVVYKGEDGIFTVADDRHKVRLPIGVTFAYHGFGDILESVTLSGGIVDTSVIYGLNLLGKALVDVILSKS